MLTDWLTRQDRVDQTVGKVLDKLDKAAEISGSKPLHDANREGYGLLRYGVKILLDVSEQIITVWLINWKKPANNDVAITEEVTVAVENIKRPNLGLYVNGIALGVLELERSTVSLPEGIYQNLDSQKKEFIRPFYATE